MKPEQKSTRSQHKPPVSVSKQRTRISCQQSHRNDDCATFCSAEARKQRLMELRRCFLCFSAGHTSIQCTCTCEWICFKCQWPNHHNTAICSGSGVAATTVSQNSSSLGSSSPSAGNVLLQTATVMLNNGQGTTAMARILDSGSQRTFISSQMADKLRLERTHRGSLSISAFAGDHPHSVTTDLVHFGILLVDCSD